MELNLNTYLQLGLLIILPLLIPILSIAIAQKGFKSIFVINEKKAVYMQGLFILSITCPILYFLSLGYISWRDYEILLTQAGLQKFLEISYLPLAALSFILPLATLSVRFHSTKQTATQIELTSKKNNADLYYSHRKELFSYFEKIGKANYLDRFIAEYKIHPRVHKNFFAGSAKDGTPIENNNAFKEIEYDIASTARELNCLIKGDCEPSPLDIYAAYFCSRIYRISMKLGLPEIYIELNKKSIVLPLKIQGFEDPVKTIGTTTDDAIAAFRYILNFYNNLCDFAGRENFLIEEKFSYLEIGTKFREINKNQVIENIIKQYS